MAKEKSGVKTFSGPSTCIQSIVAKGGEEIPLKAYEYRQGDRLLLVHNITNNPMPDILQEMNKRATFGLYLVTDEPMWAWAQEMVITPVTNRNGGVTDWFFKTPKLRLFRIGEDLAQELAAQ